VEDLGRGVEVLLGFGLVAEDAVGEIGDVKAGERVYGVGEKRGMLVCVVEVGRCRRWRRERGSSLVFGS
jgi:hypothetical protein